MKTLIVAEKPSAGKDIARVLGVTENHRDYMENEKYVVTWAVGHLIQLKNPEDVNEQYKQWKIEDLPLPHDNGLKVISKTRGQFKVIKDLIHREDINCIINAGDAGREGLLIQSWIYRMAGNRHPVKMLWASSLTDQAILEAMKKLHNESEVEFINLLREAEARAVADQMYGYNYSRLLTLLYAEPGSKTVLSYGRCQTPLLNLIYKRDMEYENFKAIPYWTINVKFSKGFDGVEVNENLGSVKCLKKELAERNMNGCKGKSAIVKSCKREEKKVKAPALFNLSELQSTLGKKFGYTPDKTLSIAQKLYETHKILSYPRTDSRYLSTDLYDEIMEHLMSCNFGKFKELIEKIDKDNVKMDRFYFNDNKVSDHHALIPTINPDIEEIYSKLTEDERNCFDEIVNSLICIFYPEYKYESTEIITEVGGRQFLSSGTTIKQLGFKSVYAKLSGNTDKENGLQILPEVEEGMELKVDKLFLKEDKTKPPARYNTGNITKLMAKYKIGTSATSAGIVQTLLDRKFIKLDKNKYISTELGRQFIKVVPEELKTADLTIQFETELKKVNTGELTKEAFLQQIRSELRENIEKLQNMSGIKLTSSTNLGECPKCGRIIKEGKMNYFCSGYNQESVCSFSIWKTIAGKTLTEAMVRDLLEKRKTALIKGFISKEEKKFDAFLILDKEYKIAFQFPKRK